jgi:hypothetical protein
VKLHTKKVLKKLKSDNGNLMEIKFVAKKLRNRLRTRADTDEQHADINASDEIDHNELINKNFWGYVKNIFTKKSDSLPTFDLAQFTAYFTRTFSAVIPNKIFNIPSWIPKFSSPTTPFNLDPPTYKITNIIRKMNPSGSPCPLDQISVICLKRCSGCVPSEWKKACTNQ